MVQLWGLMSLFRAQTASRHQFGWFDAATVGVAVAAVVWSTLYEAIFGTSEATAIDWLTRFGGAAFDVALVVVSLRLVVGSRGRQPAFVLLLVAFFLQTITDAVGALWSAYETGARDRKSVV